MDDFLKSVYVKEVKSQAVFSINAILYLNEALRGMHVVEGDGNDHKTLHSEVFRQTHSFLTHASNVSRLFWPPRLNKKKDESTEDYVKRAQFTKDRGLKLRELFSLNDQSPLKSRELRDHLEHYDERLDHWSNTSKRRIICSDTIGPPNIVSGIEATDSMRWFDPTTNSFLFRGESYSLQPIVTEISILPDKAENIERELWNRQRSANLK